MPELLEVGGDRLERRVGPEHIPGDAFTFECTKCQKRFKYAYGYPPTCTGPDELVDDHDPVLMVLIKIDKKIP